MTRAPLEVPTWLLFVGMVARTHPSQVLHYGLGGLLAFALAMLPILHVVSLIVIVALMLGGTPPSVIARRRDAASVL